MSGPSRGVGPCAPELARIDLFLSALASLSQVSIGEQPKVTWRGWVRILVASAAPARAGVELDGRVPLARAVGIPDALTGFKSRAGLKIGTRAPRAPLAVWQHGNIAIWYQNV